MIGTTQSSTSETRATQSARLGGTGAVPSSWLREGLAAAIPSRRHTDDTAVVPPILLIPLMLPS